MNHKIFLFASGGNKSNFSTLRAFSMLLLWAYFFAPMAVAQSLNREITGNMGGSVNSGDCGYIRENPHHVINLREQNFSLHLQVEASQGKPTLLIVGPDRGDRTCILGDTATGKLPHMGGVWAPGQYSIYVGESGGNQYPFTLRVVNR
ncbi:hypothetical protein IQ215_11065 [Cyanobacterium stanieri LEGE 03274]|uniref:Uncharacterized protein n=1 Tax=Cyanobacterium stanieri LEGE 03274 TaxID=1828756 RepID=A0ABR9V7Y2_9CHRO|nr:hypothetical protein [Cyanobacterium stanieri]MBE9223236.1 hypothetical protein [Cyanobacterium stanieri LEGE 03274]